MNNLPKPCFTILPQDNGDCRPCPELLTESELIAFLRIRDVSKAKDYSNAVANLKRFHDLPCIHICGKPLYPKEAILEWIRSNTGKGKQ